MSLGRILNLLPKGAKNRLKGWRKRLRLAYVRRRHGFGPNGLMAALRRVGVELGDVLLVHSSYDKFEGFSGRPSDAIRVLQDVVGTTGTLLMPTLPFTGTAVDYASRGAMFDVRRTPSQVGLLTELFRRSPSVLRSVHPTHPVAAWGMHAAEMLAIHHLARTPCGDGTPFARLLERDGRILLLGAGVESMTFFHYIEEVLEPSMPMTPFTAQEFFLQSRDETGSILVSKTRLFDPSLSRRRNLRKLEPVLRREGAWAETRLGELSIILLRANAVMQVSKNLAAQGVYCYGQ